MADNVRLIFEGDDNNLLEVLESLQKKVENLDSSFEELSKEQKKTFDNLGDGIKKANKSIDSNTKALDKNVEQSLELENQTKKSTSAMGDFIASNTSLGGKLKGVITNLKAKATALKSSTKGMGAATKGAKGLRIAMLAIPLVLFATLLAGIAKLFLSTQRGADALSSVLEPLRVAFQKLIGIGQNLATTLVDAFKNPTKALRDFGASVIDFILNPLDSIKKAAQDTKDFVDESIKQGTELNNLKKDIEKSEIRLVKRSAELNTEIKKQDLILKDQTKTFAERREAARKSSEAQNELIKLETNFIDKKIAQLEREFALNDTSRADSLELAKLEAEREQKKQAALQLESRLTVQLNSINKMASAEAKKNEDARLKRIQEINDEIQRQNDLLNDQLNELQARLDKVAFDTASSYEQLAITRQGAIDEIRELEKAILDLAKTSGNEVDVADDINKLIQNVEDEFEKGVLKLREKDNPNIEFLPSILDKEFEKGIDLPKIKVNTNESTFTSIRDAIQKGLGLDDEGFGLLQDSGKAIEGLTNQIFDAQISRQDEIINKYQERIDKQQELVNEEKRLSEEGLANNLDSELRKLNELERIREEAEKKRQEALIRQQKIQLAIDSGTQISNLVTMVTNVIAAESKKGLLGIATGVIALTTFIGLISRYKAIAKQQAELRLYHGGRIAPHLSDDRVGEGLRIQGTNIKVGGGEFVTNKKSTNRNIKFLKRINNHEFDDVDLSEMIDQNQYRVQAINQNQTVIRESKSELDYKRLEKIYSKEITRLINSNESRPLIYPNGGYKEVIKKNGSIHTKNIK